MQNKHCRLVSAGGIIHADAEERSGKTGDELITSVNYREGR